MTPVRVWIVGFGTVGQWVARALHERGGELRERFGVGFRVVGLANRRDGFVHRDAGIDLGQALALARGGGSLSELPGVARWATALDGMRHTHADVLVEVSASPADGGEPGRSHLEEALGRGIPAVTSNKWPVALHGLQLLELGRSRSAALRAESTVMSGTPVLSALGAGLAGATPISLRGVLNATANFVLTEMAGGKGYAAAVAEAQRRGLAESDPSADLDGHDTVAKLMVLAVFVFGRQLRLSDVGRRGVSEVTGEAVRRAGAEGRRIREVATLSRSPSDPAALLARVEPVALAADDPLARVDGTANAAVCRADPLGEVVVGGPGAGVELAGQGVLSDLVNVALLASRPRAPAASAPRT